MKTLTIMKHKTYRLRSVASGIGALALSALIVSAISGATALAQTTPEITLTPGEYEGRPTLQSTASETVTNWEYLRSSSDFDCNNLVFEQYEPNRDLTYIFVPSDQGDLTYCFRAKNASDVWGYAKHRFDFNPPVVSNAQLDSQPGESTVTLTVNEPVTSHYHVNDSEDCDQELTTWADQPTGETVTVTEVKNICFQLTDQSDKVTYYLYKVTSITPLVEPEITVGYHSVRNTVEATANKTIDRWAYIVSTIDLGECGEVDYSIPTGQTRVAQYTPSIHNQYYYFRGIDAAGQRACNKVIVLAALTNPNPITTTTTTTTTQQSDAPEIDIDASGRQITASHSEPVAKWRYYRSGGMPICTPDVVWDTEQNSDIVKGRQVTGLTDADVGRWVCFRALLLGTTYRGQEVYKAVQITNTWADPNNTQTLTITFLQSPTTLTAVADPTVPADRFQYLAYSGSRYPDGPNCRASNPHMTAEYWERYNAKTGDVVKLTTAVEGYYYCFRVTDDQGGASYGMYRVGGISPAAKAKTKPTERTETSSVRSLEISIDQTETTLTATTNVEAPGASWQSLVFSGTRYPDGPGCNSDNPHMTAEYWSRWETGTSNTISLKNSDEGQYYCFRVVDENDNVAIVEHKVTGVNVATETNTDNETNKQEATNTNTNTGTDTTTTTTTTTSEQPNEDQSTNQTQNIDTGTVTTGSNSDNQAPVVTVVNTSPETPAPQVTINTQAPDSQPVPIELTVNVPGSQTQAPEPVQKQPADNSATRGLLWGLGGAVATLIVLTTILAIVNRGSRH